MMRTLLLACLLAVVALGAEAFTQPAELQKLQALKQQLVQQSPAWASALESWTCPTAAANSTAGEACDPCGDKKWWGNWDHMACRSIATSYRFDQQANDGYLTHFHFSLTGVDGSAATLHGLLCPLGAHLKEWDMKVDNLVGTLPSTTPSCMPKLEEYDLSRNHLTGTIPPQLGAMPVMNQFKVHGNKQLNGPLPAEFSKLKLLEWLRVFDNQLTGTIPSSYASLNPTLTQISLGGNLFEGSLYPFADAQPQNANVTFLPKVCGMVPTGILFAAGYDAISSPGLGLPCPDEVANGWPEVVDDF